MVKKKSGCPTGVIPGRIIGDFSHEAGYGDCPEIRYPSSEERNRGLGILVIRLPNGVIQILELIIILIRVCCSIMAYRVSMMLNPVILTHLPD
jgi:hypothetical protein